VDLETVPVHDDAGNIVYLLEHVRAARAATVDPLGDGMVGRSPAFNRMVELIHRVAPTRTAVLLLGESGTGKELAARAVHEHSGCRDGPFVPVECSGLTETLFESELFGHERGAFTGAVARKPGLVEAARGGTLFLDEVGDIPLGQQVKLLRLLETGTYRPVGAVEPRRAEFRLVCATNRHLRRMVAAGEFREDLFYRLSAFPVRLPPLRERREDLPLLVESLLHRLAPGRRVAFAPDALERLRGYAFPGNVRELRNLVEYALLIADDEVIRAEHLPAECREAGEGADGGGPLEAALGPGGQDAPAEASEAVLSLAEVERRYLARVAARHPGDKRDLARRLGISERTLYRKLARV
jgi:DNA-binding NtrC family response regulator